MNDDLDTRIRTRAYHIWEKDPSPDGRAAQHWEDARRQLEAEGDGSKAASNANIDQSAEREHGGRVAQESHEQP